MLLSYFVLLLGGHRVTVGSYIMDDNSRGFEWNADGIKWKGRRIEMVDKSIPHFVTLPSSNSAFFTRYFAKTTFTSN